MIVKDQPLPTRKELTGSQRALLEERLQRARQHGAAKGGEARASIPRRTSDENIPLSFAQERLWFLDQLEPGSPVYNLCQAVRMTGSLDVVALEQALNEILRRHEVLRTNFVAIDGSPIQTVASERSLPLQLVDLTEWREGVREEELQRQLREEMRRPFDFANDVLIRALLVRTRASEHTLLLTMHHIVSDGWSIGILFKELTALYAGFCTGAAAHLPELPIQFADYAIWEREQLQDAAIGKSLEFWKQHLSGPLPVLELPADFPRTATPTSRGASQTWQFSRALTEELKAVSQQEGATLFMALQAAFLVLLYRWSGQEDLLIGSCSAGRRKSELERLIGFFVNTFVLRGDLSGEPSFRELLARVRESTLGAMAHQDLPFDRLVKELRPDRTLSRNPLFQVMFVLQNAPMAPIALPGLSLEPLDVDNGTAKFDLLLTMMETPQGLRAALEYNADLFQPATILRLLGGLQALIEGIVADPGQSIARLPLLTPGERNQLLIEWNRTTLEYERDACIHELFEAQAARKPNAVAIVGEHERVTYAELNRRADRLARRLRQFGVGPESFVGLFLRRTPRLLVGMLGVLKAGGAYVPLDPAYPAERLRFIAADAGLKVLVTERGLLAQRPEGTMELVVLDELEYDHALDGAVPAAPPTAENLAYVIYTSGSTGVPKGVCLMHRGVVALVAWARQLYRPEELNGVLFATSASFDVSVFESLVPLCLGGKIVLAENLLQLASLPAAREVTLVSGVPSAMAELVRTKSFPASVRTVNVAGEPCPQTLVEALYALGPIERVYDVYGPTETTVYSTGGLRVRGGRATIGRPLPNEQAYILDRHLQPVPVGVRGELFIGGDKLARGYLNRPELTAARFVEAPFAPGRRLYRTGDGARYHSDGTIEYLGRLDRQAKIRGYRVEPAEVEAMLARHPAVKECAVVVRDDASGTKALFAYLVPKPSPAPGAATWRTFLEERLPDYLVPSVFVALDALPLTPNGKLDLKALPALEGARPELQHRYVAPRDSVEQQLVGIWEAVLGVRPIGVHDRFFDLGGHSLLAVRVAAQIERKFGQKLPLAAIFQQPTVERLARLVWAKDQRYAPATSIVEIQGHGTRPAIYLVHGIGGGMFWGYSNLARHLGTDQPLYAFKSRGLDGLPEWPTIEEMAANYVADLRAHQPRGPYLLGGYCFGGVVAYEMARQLRAQGEDIELLALMNSSPPNTGYERIDERYTLAWKLKFLRNLAFWFVCFVFRWTVRERVEFIRWKYRVLRRRTNGLMGSNSVDLAVTDVDEMVNLAAYSEDQRRVWAAHVKALRAYQPQPYAGPVTLFRTRGYPFLCSFDRAYGWGSVVRDAVDVRMMPGGHGSILDEPHVRAVAAAMKRCVEEKCARLRGEVA